MKKLLLCFLLLSFSTAYADECGDLNGDEFVNFLDLALFKSQFGKPTSELAQCGGGPPPPTGNITGLDFPSNQAFTQSIRFRFTGSNLNPIYPATYIWRVNLRQQNGYYTTFFWGNDGPFYWGSPNGDPDSYYGAHPYPDPPPNGSAHRWEVSAYALDVTGDTVQYGRWYQQALIVWKEGSVARHEFYYDLPNTSKKISYSTPSYANYGTASPPNPALTWGDAPWNESQERLSGILRGIQIYDSRLSISEVLAEIDSPGSVADLWYLNLNPTPDDISDKSGNNHDPQWINNGRPSLWVP